MKSLLFLPLVLAASATPTALDVRLALTVESGTKVTSTFTSELVLELESLAMKLTVGDEEHELEAPEMQMRIQQNESLTFTDEYLAVEDGVATRVKRRFDALGESSSRAMTDPEGEESEEDEEGDSELEGHTVVLAWDADDELWTAKFADDDDGGDEELLSELVHDADLTAFLPSGEVAVGAEWEVPARAFLTLGEPCGDLHIISPSDEDDDEMDQALEDQFDENISGTITASLTSVEGGLATIALTFELETEGEAEDDDVEVEEGMSISIKRSLELEFELEGTLVWNIEKGHAVSLVVEGKVAFVSTQFQSSEQGGQAFQIEQTQNLAGTLKHTVEIE